MSIIPISERSYMIISNEVEIKVVPKTFSYWKNLYQNAQVFQLLSVNVNHLPKKSNTVVKCACDSCKRVFEQRYSRNTDVCGHCILSSRMKGNSLGKGNATISSPSRSELLKYVQSGMGKQSIAKEYGVSISVVNRWLSENGIIIRAHYGRRHFKTEEDELKTISRINDENDKGIGISEISRITKVPRHVINELRNSGAVKLKTQFDHWEDAYNDILSNIDFYKSENSRKNLNTISDENNISIELLKKAFRELNIDVKLHSYNKSKGEKECLSFVRSLGFNCYSAMIEKKYEVDCYVPEKKFGIEYCGEFWHRYVEAKNNKYYHKNKCQFVKARGIQLFTVFESEWMTKNDIVRSMISSKLGISKRIFARSCSVVEIPKNVANMFHDSNHISGHANSSINLGLYHNDVLVSVLSIIKSRFDKNFEYEISRFSSLCGHTVVGGLGKLFSSFEKKYSPSSCMTYSDLRFGHGKSYEKIGFSYLGDTVPNYFYYHKNKKYLESRMRYQKHKLVNMPEYTGSKSEFEIMESAGYYRLYDCGNARYGWRKNPHP